MIADGHLSLCQLDSLTSRASHLHFNLLQKSDKQNGSIYIHLRTIQPCFQTHLRHQAKECFTIFDMIACNILHIVESFIVVPV